MQGVEPEALRAGLDGTVAGLHSALYTLADAAAAPVADAATRKAGPLNALAYGLESVLEFYQGKLDAQGVPFSYGWSIVLLVLSVKVLTFPLIKTQVESSLAVQNLKPRLDAIKARYGEDEERVKKETAILYEKAQVNPLAGCLPTLATIPFFIGLYRSLSNAADEGIFDNEGFYWVPSLAGPTTVAARASGGGTDWLFPLVDGAPPIGWDDAQLYLVLPVLVVAAQYWSASVLQPPESPDENEQAKTMKVVVKFLPLMIGWFSLNLPSGLSLYYFTNIVLTAAQQIFLRKLGGAAVEEVDLGPIKNLGSARRNGEPLQDEEVAQYLGRPVLMAARAGEAASSAPAEEEPARQVQLLQKRSKRKRVGPPPTSKQPEEATVTVTADQLENEFPGML